MSEESSTIITLIIASTFLAALMSFFIIAMVLLHRQRQAQNRQKLDRIKSEYERTLLNIENEIQQETLTHVGRELHDNIGQLLSLAKLKFGSLKEHRREEGREALRLAIQEVRQLSKRLNLDWADNISISEFTDQQLQQIPAEFCETKLEINTNLDQLPKEQKLILIRVIQECLNNAIKHAAPDKIEITFFKNGGLRQISVRDNGKGFDPSGPSTGSGMHNLRKRMGAMGGGFAVNSSVGKGTQILLTLPK